jgi:prepilin signal peptidase PulO-like enzyme (type II secretory pathway)
MQKQGFLELRSVMSFDGEAVNESLFYRTNEVVINWLFFALMLTATEIGFRLGRKLETGTPESIKSQISTVEAAILGILALLLGFTVSMAVSRFETRKQLVLEEADAIGTSSLRAQLLPAPAGPEIQSLLRQYVDVRVQYGTTGNNLARLEDLNRQTARLQTEFWTRAAAYAQQDPNPVKVGLLLQSMNQAIDLAEARWIALQNHVPESVIYVNAAVGLLSAMLVGYSFGVNGRRNIFSMFMLAVSITLVLAVIIDLDRPRSGYIRVSQEPMIDLLQRR